MLKVQNKFSLLLGIFTATLVFVGSPVLSQSQVGFEGAASVPPGDTTASPSNNWQTDFNFSGTEADFRIRSPDYVADAAGSPWYVLAEGASFGVIQASNNSPKSGGNDGLGINITAAELIADGFSTGDIITYDFEYSAANNYDSGNPLSGFRPSDSDSSIAVWAGNGTVSSFSNLSSTPTTTVVVGAFSPTTTFGGRPVMPANSWRQATGSFSWTGGDVFFALQAVTGSTTTGFETIFVDNLIFARPPRLVARDDTVATPVDATTAQTGVVDIFANGVDTLDGVATDETEVTVRVAPGSSLPAGFTLNADGTVDIAAGTAPGPYTFDYEICETLAPLNCATATVSVTVGAGGIGVVKGSVFNDEITADGNGQVGETITYTYTVSNEGDLDLDTVELTETNFTGNGTQPTPALDATSDTGSDNILSVGENWTYTATYTLDATDVANGSVGNQATATGETPNGTTVSDLSDSSNPADGNGTGTPGPGTGNDETTSTSFGTNPIVANDDTVAAVNGTVGATIPNVVANDTLNGLTNPAIGPGGVSIAVDTPATPVNPGDPVPVLNTADGTVDVPAGTPAGTYNIVYEICEDLNPTNCDTATVTVVVEAVVIAEIEEDLTAVLEEDLANTLTQQSNQISGYSADALDRLRDRGGDQCMAAVNLEARNILFDVDRAIIKPESHATLDAMAAILAGCPGSAFEIAGHTDSDASDAYNIDLSQRRVNAVRQALAARGVDTSGYVARGYGESQPIASNATAAGKAQNRRVEFRLLDDVDGGYTGPCNDSFSLMRSLNAHADENGMTADGSFMRDQHDCITDRREVFEGTLSYLDTEQGQTQSAINLSYRREQYRGSDSVFGYFVGAYGTRSDVTRLATGEISGYGLNAGVYGANRLDNDLFLDYYLGAAAGRHSFDLAFSRDIGTVSASGDYTYFAGFAGAALSGQIELGDTTLTPRVGFDYVYTPGADVDVVAEVGGLSEAGGLELDAISGGRAFAEIRWDQLVDDGQTNLWVNPRMACYQSIGALDGACGFGGSIGIESTDEDGDTNYALELDSEWGDGYTQGSLTGRISRQLDVGTISGDASVTRNGNTTLGANYELEF